VRDNAIIQIAYTVADIQKAMRHYSELLHIGPWFLVGPFVPPKGVYRGVTTTMQISLGLAFSGQMMIELIQQHDDKPLVFGETLKARGAHGFHHWAIGARDFAKSVAHYRALGYAEAFSDTANRQSDPGSVAGMGSERDRIPSRAALCRNGGDRQAWQECRP
jgi:hypothetical protein